MPTFIPTTHDIEEKKRFLRGISHKLLENKIEALRLNIERRALKKQLNELSRYPILTFYAVMVQKQLEDNKKLMDLIAEEQKTLKYNHSVYSHKLCNDITLFRLHHERQ